MALSKKFYYIDSFDDGFYVGKVKLTRDEIVARVRKFLKGKMFTKARKIHAHVLVPPRLAASVLQELGWVKLNSKVWTRQEVDGWDVGKTRR